MVKVRLDLNDAETEVSMTLTGIDGIATSVQMDAAMVDEMIEGLQEVQALLATGYEEPVSPIKTDVVFNDEPSEELRPRFRVFKGMQES